jgi:hypothetical protein
VPPDYPDPQQQVPPSWIPTKMMKELIDKELIDIVNLTLSEQVPPDY